MKGSAGAEELEAKLEELEAWLCSLLPRAELIARMALRQHRFELSGRSYFARIAWLIRELDLSAEGLSAVRADALRVAACLAKAPIGREVA